MYYLKSTLRLNMASSCHFAVYYDMNMGSFLGWENSSFQNCCSEREIGIYREVTRNR